MTIKPQERAFIVMRMMYVVLLCVIIATIISSVFGSIVPFVLGLFCVGVAYWYVRTEYAKRIYDFEAEKITQRSGTPFTDQENELLLKNVTHVSLRLPFVQYRLFGTGKIDVESAGSRAAEIHFAEVDRPRELFAQVQEQMKAQGISLDTGELLLEERPHSLAIFFEVFKNFLGAIGLIFYVASDVLETVLSYISSKGLGFGLIVGAGSIGALIAWQFLNFLDLRKRIYGIYRNVIVYSEGFLSKNYTIIPYQNLSDTEVTQTFVDKIFGLYDVKVSGKGSGHQIFFKNLANGQKVSEVLDDLIMQTRDNGGNFVREGQMSERVVQSEDVSHRLQPQSEFELVTQPDMWYQFVPGAIGTVLIGLVLGVVAVVAGTGLSGVIAFVIVGLLIGSIYAVLYSKTHTYSLKKAGVESRFNFLTKQVLEFNLEKVTGVVVRQNVIQKWFGVATIDFLSIGSHHVLQFKNIRDYDEALTGIREKFGMHNDIVHSARSRYNILAWVKSNAFLALVMALAYGIIIVLAVAYGATEVLAVVGMIAVAHLIFTIIVVLYNRYYYLLARIDFLWSHIYAQKGFLWKRYYYIPYNGIKDIVIERYPLSQEGWMELNIAGDAMTQEASGRGLNKHGPVFSSHIFRLDFINHIAQENINANFLLQKLVRDGGLPQDLSGDLADEVLSISHPDVKNALLPMLVPIILLGLVAFGFIAAGIVSGAVVAFVLIVMIVGFVVVDNRMRSYVVTQSRVIARSGIFYKRETSVLNERINFINKTQGFVGKIFGNGNVTIHTVGSDGVEIFMANIPDYEKIYADLKSRYENESV